MTIKRSNHIRLTREDIILDSVIYFILAVVFFICAYPFWYGLVISLNDSMDTAKGNLYFWPRVWTLDNYKHFFRDATWLRGFLISVARTVCGSLITTLFTMLVSYGLSHKQLVFRKAYMAIIIFSMYFSGGLIPTFLTFRAYGLMNNFLVYIIPTAISAFNVLVMRSFIEGLPYDLVESAKIDGASEYRILFTIIMPLSLPVIATIGLFVCVSQWNQWFDTMLYCSSKKNLITLQYKLKQVLDAANSMTGDAVTQEAMASSAEEGSGRVTTTTIRAAMTVISVVPIACVYPFLQKYFVKGMTLGAVKG